MASIAFSVPSALTVSGTTTASGALVVGGSTTLSSLTASTLLYLDGSKVAGSVSLSSNLTLTTGTLALSTALTSINSITASSATDLTLSGGSSGASLVLGQGASGGAILALRGTGSLFIPGASKFSALGDVPTATAFQGLWLGMASQATGSGTYAIAGDGSVTVLNTSGSSIRFADSGVEFARFSPTNHNLLIGTTSETGLTGGGGLKVASTTSATNSTTGALLVGNGTAATNVAIGGGNINAGGTITSAGVTVTGSTSTSNSYNWGTDATLYRTAVGSIGLVNTSAASDAFIELKTSGTTNNLGFRFGTTGNNTAGGYLASNVTSGSANLQFGVNGSLVALMTSTATTLAGNLTVSGTGTSTVGSAGSGTLHVGNTFSNSATLFSYGTLKVGGSVSQGTGVIVLGDDQSSAQNVGIYRGQSDKTMGSGNWLWLGGYEGVGITAGSASALGAQNIAAKWDTSGNLTNTGNLTVSGTGTSTFAGPVTVSSGAADTKSLRLTENGTRTLDFTVTSSNTADIAANVPIRFSPSSTLALTLSSTTATFAGSAAIAQGLGLGVTSTVTAAGTTTLTSTSTVAQIFTGTLGQNLQLPAANMYGAGLAVTYMVKNRSSGNVVILRAGADQIDGATSYTLMGGSNAAVILISDGVSNWSIV